MGVVAAEMDGCISQPKIRHINKFNIYHLSVELLDVVELLHLGFTAARPLPRLRNPREFLFDLKWMGKLTRLRLSTYDVHKVLGL